MYLVKSFGGFCLVRYPKGRGGYRVRESRLYRTEAEVQLVIDYKKKYKKYMKLKINCVKIKTQRVTKKCKSS